MKKITAISVLVALLICAAAILFVTMRYAPMAIGAFSGNGYDDSVKNTAFGYDDDDFMGDDKQKTASASPEQTPQSSPSATDTAETPAPTTCAVITLSDNATVIDGIGAEARENVINITAAGQYELSGTLTAGQIVVNVPKTERVYLVLCGVNVTSRTNAPLYIESCDKTVITLKEGSVNTFSDPARYTDMNEQGEPNACVFAKDDLTIKGSGELIVHAAYGNGICSKDDLKITGGIITVTAAKHGLKGNDSVLVHGGTISITAAKDGIKATTADNSEKGFVEITAGRVLINAHDDGIQAVSFITVSGGKVNVVAHGERFKCDGELNISAACIE